MREWGVNESNKTDLLTKTELPWTTGVILDTRSTKDAIQNVEIRVCNSHDRCRCGFNTISILPHQNRMKIENQNGWLHCVEYLVGQYKSMVSVAVWGINYASSGIASVRVIWIVYYFYYALSYQTSRLLRSRLIRSWNHHTEMLIRKFFHDIAQVCFVFAIDWSDHVFFGSLFSQATKSFDHRLLYPWPTVP